MTTTAPNGTLIRTLRLAASYTVADLGAVIGVQPETIRRLEQSDPRMLNVLTGRQLIGLAKALGTDLNSIVSSDTPRPVAATDPVQLLAALHGQRQHIKKTVLAHSLEWDLTRLDAACSALDDRLRPVGLVIRQAPRGWKLALLEGTITRTVSKRLAATQADLHGLEHATVRVLHSVAYARPGTAPFATTGRPPSEDRLNRLAALERLGLITSADQHPAMSQSLKYALNLP